MGLQITSLFCGDPVRPPLLLLGIAGTTFFVSMWIHNTACTVMMMPVATGILQRLPRGGGGGDAGAHEEVRRFSKAVVLGVVYASAIGGMATLAGTGVNIILVGMWSTYFPEQQPITFSSWNSCPSASPWRSSSSWHSGSRSATCTAPTTPERHSLLTWTEAISEESSAC